MRTCAKCNQEKELNSFYKHPNGRDGLDSRCKSCHLSLGDKFRKERKLRTGTWKPEKPRMIPWIVRNKERQKDWRKAYESRPEVRKRIRDYVKKARCRWLYGISPEDLAELRKKQNEKCALCGEDLLLGKRITIDHDHKTGKVRGLLHQKCNTILGFIERNPDIVRKAEDFLNLHSVEDDDVYREEESRRIE